MMSRQQLLELKAQNEAFVEEMDAIMPLHIVQPVLDTHSDKTSSAEAKIAAIRNARRKYHDWKRQHSHGGNGGGGDSHPEAIAPDNRVSGMKIVTTMLQAYDGQPIEPMPEVEPVVFDDEEPSPYIATSSTSEQKEQRPATKTTQDLGGGGEQSLGLGRPVHRHQRRRSEILEAELEAAAAKAERTHAPTHRSPSSSSSSPRRRSSPEQRRVSSSDPPGPPGLETAAKTLAMAAKHVSKLPTAAPSSPPRHRSPPPTARRPRQSSAAPRPRYTGTLHDFRPNGPVALDMYLSISKYSLGPHNVDAFLDKIPELSTAERNVLRQTIINDDRMLRKRCQQYAADFFHPLRGAGAGLVRRYGKDALSPTPPRGLRGGTKEHARWEQAQKGLATKSLQLASTTRRATEIMMPQVQARMKASMDEWGQVFTAWRKASWDSTYGWDVFKKSGVLKGLLKFVFGNLFFGAATLLTGAVEVIYKLLQAMLTNPLTTSLVFQLIQAIFTELTEEFRQRDIIDRIANGKPFNAPTPPITDEYIVKLFSDMIDSGFEYVWGGFEAAVRSMTSFATVALGVEMLINTIRFAVVDSIEYAIISDPMRTGVVRDFFSLCRTMLGFYAGEA